jgi:hypothetical protein
MVLLHRRAGAGVATVGACCHPPIGGGRFITRGGADEVWLVHDASDMIDRTLLLTLLRLRYRLLVATARSRTGKVMLLTVGYLFLLLVGGFLFLGGAGAALAAVHAGKTAVVLRIVLGGMFLTSLLASAMLGVGVAPAFSDAVLRRFPLRPRERFGVRHLTAILEPLWLLVLAIDVGVAAGCATVGAGLAWAALPAAVLLLGSNYLAAQALITLVGRMMQTRLGRNALALVVVLGVCLAPALSLPAAARSSGVLSSLAGAASVTPPFIAAAAMSSHGWRSLAPAVGLLAWILGLAAGLVAVERWRPVARTTATATAAGDTLHDRVADLFGPTLAPLAGKMLRYCTRSPQVRLTTVLALPAFVLLVLQTGHGESAMRFPAALGGLALFAGTASGGLSLNLFGFDGAGFRRYFLLPVTPSRVLLVAGVVVLLPGACLIPGGILLWAVHSPIRTDIRSLAMLASSGAVGLLLYSALGIWTSVLAPTAVEFDRTWGNKLSLPANAVLVAGILSFFGLVGAIRGLRIDDDALVRHWWVTAALIPPTSLGYLLTVHVAGRIMMARRERMLETIDPT